MAMHSPGGAGGGAGAGAGAGGAGDAGFAPWSDAPAGEGAGFGAEANAGVAVDQGDDAAPSESNAQSSGKSKKVKNKHGRGSAAMSRSIPQVSEQNQLGSVCT